MRDPFHQAWRPPRAWHVEATPVVVAALREGRAPLLSVVTGAGKTDQTCHLAWLGAGVGPEDCRGAVIAVPTQALVEQTHEALVKRATCDGTIEPLFSAGMWYAGSKDSAADVVVACFPSLMSLALAWRGQDRRPNLLIVDEAHGSEADSVAAAVDLLDPRRICGLTATPYRAGQDETLAIFSDVAYSYSYQQAVDDGVLVPRRIVRWDSTEMVSVDEAVLRMLAEHGPRQEDGRLWRTVIDARSIADAEGYAERLVEAGIAAAATHSDLTKDEQKKRLSDLESGTIEVLVHVNLLSEGVDLPWLRCYALRDRCGSRNRLVQRVGRVLRPDPDDPSKVYGLVLDPLDLCRSIGLEHDAEVGGERAAREAEEKAKKDLRGWKKAPPELREVLVSAARSEGWAYLGRLALELRDRGILDEPEYVAGRWRRESVTAGQARFLTKLTRRIQLADPDGREVLRRLADDPKMNKGGASDLIGVLTAIKRHTYDEAKRRPSGSISVETPAPTETQRVLDLHHRATTD